MEYKYNFKVYYFSWCYKVRNTDPLLISRSKKPKGKLSVRKMGLESQRELKVMVNMLKLNIEDSIFNVT